MRAVDIIRAKRDGGSLTNDQIETFIAGVITGDWADYQCAALLMAIVLRGMTPAETAALTAAMVRSGVQLDWGHLSGAPVDKHSTGGVGDKTSLVLAPLAAACGVLVPMMSGRGLGHTGGTLDKLESIPGFQTQLALHDICRVVEKVGCVMVSPTDEIAPADRKLYALRDVTGTVESVPLISASIMSKKLAEGIRGLVLDVKYGHGAFMSRMEDARALAASMREIGQANGVPTRTLLTPMNVPHGRAAGNALEVRECIEVLKGGGPSDVRHLSLHLAAHMVHLAGVTPHVGEAIKQVDAALRSGRGLEKFRQIVEHQGGDPRIMDDHTRLPSAPQRELVRAHRPGHFHGWNALRVGRAVCALGAGRQRTEDSVDHAVGVIMYAQRGDQVREGDPLLELHYRDQARLAAALAELREACPIEDAPPSAVPLIHEVLD